MLNCWSKPIKTDPRAFAPDSLASLRSFVSTYASRDMTTSTSAALERYYIVAGLLDRLIAAGHHERDAAVAVSIQCYPASLGVLLHRVVTRDFEGDFSQARDLYAFVRATLILHPFQLLREAVG